MNRKITWAYFRGHVANSIIEVYKKNEERITKKYPNDNEEVGECTQLLLAEYIGKSEQEAEELIKMRKAKGLII